VYCLNEDLFYPKSTLSSFSSQSERNLAREESLIPFPKKKFS